jgi:hypothetical protein
MTERERIVYRGCKALKVGEYKKTGRYYASNTEVLLEDICKSFGTELMQAYINPINGIKLTRESKPALVMNPDGKNKVLQFQYTKFTPFFSSKWFDIYKQNRRRKISEEGANKNIEKELEGKNMDFLDTVIDSHCINNLPLHRFQKALYFAVYNLDNKAPEKLEPFSVYDITRFNGKLPEVHMTLSIEPFFVINQTCENTKQIYDNLRIRFPEADSKHATCTKSALDFHPLYMLDKEKIHGYPDSTFESHCEMHARYQIHSQVPRELTMGFIHAYLKKFSLDKGVIF